MPLSNEILAPEKCILCHKSRRDPKARDDDPLPETPFCDPCFHGTAPYYREHLMWTRRKTLAFEAMCSAIATAANRGTLALPLNPE